MQMPKASNKCVKAGDFAEVDIDRLKRRGFPEVIYCPGKTKEQIKKIAGVLLKQKQTLLFTRLDRKIFSYLKKSYPRLKYNPKGRVAYIKSRPLSISRQGAYSSGKNNMVCVVCAGTSDIPVAEEAATTLEVMGNPVLKLYDLGVAGVHRVLTKVDLLRKCRVIIVVAGMEGALASIVSGLVACPVIAVPTSIGYGANFFGLAPLLTMLNSCSPGISVVNIDNGFGAAYFASLINK
ncbi:MAG: nickel pincer cofactor biosynthesis protein LarB [Candidatus Omnitrophota bacterium]